MSRVIRYAPAGGALTLAAQFLRFCGAGAAATAAQYAALVTLASLLQMGAVPASALAYSLGALINYILNYRYTFRSTSGHHAAMVRFTVVALAGLALNTAFMYLLTRGLGAHYLVAQVFATGAVLIWNFAANRAWTFKP
jgi:putative flippase GtrA